MRLGGRRPLRVLAVGGLVIDRGKKKKNFSHFKEYLLQPKVFIQEEEEEDEEEAGQRVLLFHPFSS